MVLRSARNCNFPTQIYDDDRPDRLLHQPMNASNASECGETNRVTGRLKIWERNLRGIMNERSRAQFTSCGTEKQDNSIGIFDVVCLISFGKCNFIYLMIFKNIYEYVPNASVKSRIFLFFLFRSMRTDIVLPSFWFRVEMKQNIIKQQNKYSIFKQSIIGLLSTHHDRQEIIKISILTKNSRNGN